MITTKAKTVLNLFVTAITAGNVYSIKNAFAIVDIMENIARKVCAKIIAILMVLVIKENVFAKADGAEKPVIFDYVLKTVMEMENA